MIYLLLSILSSTVIFVTFKLYDRFKVNTLQAIVVNYITAASCGLIGYSQPINIASIGQQPWFIYTLLLGVLFITIFYLMAITTQRSGLSVVSVATKMSVVIPVLSGLIFFRESVGFLKLLGILLALVAVYLASIKTKKGLKIQRNSLMYPMLVFLGSGIIDSSLKILEDLYVAADDVPIFSSTIFAAAATIGICIVGYQRLKLNKRLEAKSILGGIALGIPNYFSVYFLVQALRSDIFESSGIFTVNNVAIVMMSTLVGILLFREKMLPKNWVGISVAIISILLVAGNS